MAPIDQANPLSGGSLIAFDGIETPHGIYVHAADFHHVVAAAQKVIHAAEMTAKRAGPLWQQTTQVAHIETDDRRDMTGEAGHNQVACYTGRNRSARLRIEDLQIDEILHQI